MAKFTYCMFVHYNIAEVFLYYETRGRENGTDEGKEV